MVGFLSLVMVLPAFAEDIESSVSYEGGAEKFVFLPGSEYSETDLFDNFKYVMPGDILTEKIIVKNNYKGCDYVNIYMRAVPHDDKNPLSEKVAKSETVVSMEEFLKQLEMTVKQGDKELFHSTLDQEGGLTNNILIARLANGASAELVVELDVPIELGNEYANRVGEVDWVFLAEERNNPSPDEPNESEEPEVYPYVPMIQAPKTGDSANLILWIAVLAGAAVAVIYVSTKRRRR